ncbi:putative membrane protein YphA (DoxX/SURF4 family) [Pseudarthrobacter sp. W1I19]|uniref:ArnT family glycosyltransferase n=1 Tax=Pseudarthrobacter sp. W1I19 TaxID=3042288 RepID=UPI0027861AEA|nr:glycosyltransferase family 39 protein [Pseudarthrobacter sp. W1I19]MDQ0922357.1 putative membrane protein YphA (DoxX/SURF4 family) [Pseudarthrobacter sp. W1I19]
MTSETSEKYAAPALPRQKKDKTVAWLTTAAAFISVLMYAYIISLNLSLTYYDAIPHLTIARRVIDSPTSGLAQLGGVWLPLPHLLSVPFIWTDWSYFSGFAGSIISMAAYLFTSVLLYKIAYTLTASRTAGVVSAAIFMLNPNVLYMQSTPMTELLLFACIAGTVYGLQRWIQTDEHKYLLAAGIAVLAGTLTRYEAWVFFCAVAPLIVAVAWRRGYTYQRAEGTVLAFAYVAGLGIALWLLWNQVIFNDVANFYSGKYAKPSLWVNSGDPAVGNWWVALQTYYYATLENLSIPLAILMVLGFGIMGLRERFAPKLWPTIALLIFIPFFVLALESGQRPLWVEQIGGSLYNVRFGLLMILPAAISSGYVVSLIQRNSSLRKAAAAALVCLTVAQAVVGVVSPNSTATLRETTSQANIEKTRTPNEVSSYLKDNYVGGKILMESFGNEFILFHANIPPGQNIDEGSYRLWGPAIVDPASSGITWIIMRHTEAQPDHVYLNLHGKQALDQYALALESDDYYVYKAR